MHNNIQMRKKLTIYSLALLGIAILFNSCKKEYESIENIDEAKIQAYIKQNNLTMTKDPSGFYYQVITNGTGAPLLNKDSVFYKFTIKSLTGETYYSSPTYGNEGSYLGYLYPESYRIALAGTNRGSKVRIILPSYLAYGKNGNSSIPSNEVLVGEISTYTETAQWQIDDKTIINFLAANNLIATKSPMRVYYKNVLAGTGTEVDIGSTVTVKYTGRLLNGTVFDQTVGDATFVYQATGDVIKGWDVLMGMKAGAKVRIFVPSDLGYGASTSGNIPGNSVLDFDIEIVNVVN
jgi:FKBP-type peptidyl-prolyl cis-trans isomerase FkpA